MARKWFLLFFASQSVLKPVPSKAFSKVVGLFLSTILVIVFLNTVISPVMAHTPAESALQLFERGQKFYRTGQFSEAASVWQRAADAYAQKGDREGTAQSQINMAEAQQKLGRSPQACNTLLEAFGVADFDCWHLAQSSDNQQQDVLLKALKQQQNSITKAIGLRSLGDVLQKLDNLELSTKVLHLSLDIAQRLRSKQEESAALLSLGNAYQTWGDKERARLDRSANSEATPWRCLYNPTLGASKDFYQQAATFYYQAVVASVSPLTWIQAQINRLNALLEINALSDAQALWPQIQSKLKVLPVSKTGIYTQFNFALSLKCVKEAVPDANLSWEEIAQILATATQQARSIGDLQAESYGLGYLAGVYIQTPKQRDAQSLSYAQDLTQQALRLVSATEATDIIYLWQWQLGQLLKARRDFTGAIAAYTEAVNTLQSLRSDLSATDTNIQFSFRESVEPVYRQLVELLLRSSPSSQEKLKQARDVIEALQLAELENLLGCNLPVASPAPIDQTTELKAAVIYPIILADRLDVILSLPTQNLRHYSSSIPPNWEDRLETLNQNLQTPDGAGPGFLELSQQVYDSLLRPAKTELETSGVKILVFVLDGALRQIPMAVLHDGQQYLIEKYAVAVSPSLQLLKPQPLSRKKLEVLAAGISKKIPGFSAPPLPEVKDELKVISDTTKSTVLRNQDFTRIALKNKIKERPFSVVHLATHGQFSSQPNQTYVRAWDAQIDPSQLKTLLQTQEQNLSNPIELLVLSGCDTAEGDKRATLGLAGVAVRAGVRSTLASLWEINDNSTAELMVSFYQSLSNPTNSALTLAQALQNAQLRLLRKYKSPFYWAAYVLVGNWL